MNVRSAARLRASLLSAQGRASTGIIVDMNMHCSGVSCMFGVYREDDGIR